MLPNNYRRYGPTPASASIYSLLVFLCTLPIVSSAQTVFKCVDKVGHVTFSSNPCKENTEAEIIEVPGDAGRTDAEAAEISARRIEAINAEIRAYEDAREKREARGTSAVASAPSQNRHCGDVTIYSYQPYDSQSLDGSVDIGGGVSGWVSTHRCAVINFRLNGYGGQINDREYASKIARNFQATLANGNERTGSSGSIRADRRIQLGRDYTGNFCFGISDFPIVEINCR